MIHGRLEMLNAATVPVSASDVGLARTPHHDYSPTMASLAVKLI